MKDLGISCSPKEIYYDINEPGKAIKQIFSKENFFFKQQKKIEFYYGDRGSNEGMAGIETPSLLNGLRRIETILSCHKKRYLLRLYARPVAFYPARDPVKSEAQLIRLQRLMKVSYPKQGERMAITCFTLYQNTKWLVIVGCGDISFSNRKGGWIYCWNIKNVYQPYFRIQTPSSVTALSCSPHVPQLLAAALLDGSVRVYTFTSLDYTLLFDTRTCPDFGCHSAPVWQLGWRTPKAVRVKPLRMSGELPPLKDLLGSVKKNKNLDYVQAAIPVISISEDGTIREWVFSKESGLLTSSVLTRISSRFYFKTLQYMNWNSPETKSDSSSNIFPLTSPGTCFEFPPGIDTNSFIIGTHFGDVAMWHTFRSGTPSAIFEGHSMPVTSVAWQLTIGDRPTRFLSSSLDGTIKIWDTSRSKPIRVLSCPKVSSCGYTEASWCPWLTTLLIGVHENGIHFWDLASGAQSPVHSFSLRGITSAKFNQYSRVLIVSDETGLLSFYKISGFGDGSLLFLKLTTAIRKLIKLDPFR